MLTFQPVVDGTLLTRPPLEAVRAGSAAGVTLVAGTTADEWNLFHLRVRQAGGMDERQVHRRLARMVGDDRVGDVMAAYRTARPGADLDGLVCALMTDRVFRMPAIRLAEAQLPHAPRVAMYRFDHPSVAFGNVLGACHGIEIPFVFGTLARGGTDAFIGELDDASHRLSDRCVRAWTGVARAGDPAHDDLEWPAYDRERRATAVLDRSPTVLDDPEGDLRVLWEEIGGIAP
jgi:para-nitrobenzyl esterase